MVLDNQDHLVVPDITLVVNIARYLFFLVVLDLQHHLLVLEDQYLLYVLVYLPFLFLLYYQEDPWGLDYHLYTDSFVLIVSLLHHVC